MVGAAFQYDNELAGLAFYIDPAAVPYVVQMPVRPVV